LATEEDDDMVCCCLLLAASAAAAACLLVAACLLRLPRGLQNESEGTALKNPKIVQGGKNSRFGGE
jgi:hypothetical protein